MDGGMVFIPGVRGFPPGASCRATLTQKAPGGSRGTPGRAPSRVPCEADSNRGITCRRAAWMAGWFSYPVSPGFHPGLLGCDRPTKSPRQEPGDSGSRAFPCAMRSGFEPGNHVPSCSMDRGEVFIPGVPGFPPGASCRATLTQKAPGGSRGTPGRAPSRVPCETGSHCGNASSRTAWIAGWLSCPVSPGFHPGLVEPVSLRPALFARGAEAHQQLRHLGGGV